MAEELAEQPEPQEPQGPQGKSGLKIVLVAVIVILLAGLGVAYMVLKPAPPPNMEAYLWPEPEAGALEIASSISDGSSLVVTDVRFKTEPAELEKDGLGAQIEEEFEKLRPITMDILTEAANGLKQDTAATTKEFKRSVRKAMNEELKNCQIEDVLVKNWVVQSTS